jgi:hypothetical protein
MAVLTPRLGSPTRAAGNQDSHMDTTLRVKARAYGEQQLEALGYASKMEFELDDGSVVELTHPWLWSDEVQAAHDAVRSGADLDRDTSGEIADPPKINKKPAEPQSVRIARAVLGRDAHKKFVAGGGSSNQIVLAIELMRKKSVDVEETADPKDGPS